MGLIKRFSRGPLACILLFVFKSFAVERERAGGCEISVEMSLGKRKLNPAGKAPALDTNQSPWELLNTHGT